MKSQSYNPNIPSDTSIISQPTDSKGVTATSRTSPEQSSQKTAETNLTTREKNFINSFKDADVEKLEKAVKRLEEEWKKSERKESENISRAVKDEFQNSNDSKLGEKLLTFLGEFETVQKEFLQRDELAKTLQPNETSQKNEFSAKAIRNFIQGALQTSKNTEQKVPTITEVENKVEAFFNVFDLHETSDKKGANISEEEMKNPEYLKLIIDKLDVIETRINLIKNTEWKEWNNNFKKLIEITNIITSKSGPSFGGSARGIKQKLEEIKTNLEKIYENLGKQHTDCREIDRLFTEFGRKGGTSYKRGLPPQVILGVVQPIQFFIEDQQDKVSHLLNQTLPNLEKLLPQETSPQNS